MPRKAREKSPESVYHIMCRSESEILLFRDGEDKDYYLGLRQDIYKLIDKSFMMGLFNIDDSILCV